MDQYTQYFFKATHTVIESDSGPAEIDLLKCFAAALFYKSVAVRMMICISHATYLRGLGGGLGDPDV